MNPEHPKFKPFIYLQFTTLYVNEVAPVVTAVVCMLSPRYTARFSAVPDERLASWNNRLFHDANLSSGTAENRAVCLGL